MRLVCSSIDEDHHSITIHDIGNLNFDFEDETDSVSTVPLTFAPFDFLTCVVSTRASQTDCFDTLDVNGACTLLSFTPPLVTHVLAKCC